MQCGDLKNAFFFFQAEDGIRDLTVTGVQTCALPIWGWREDMREVEQFKWIRADARRLLLVATACAGAASAQRSEEHTSELQSQSNLVCRLLLEKKKKKTYTHM